MKAIADAYLSEIRQIEGPARGRVLVLLPYGQLLAVAAAQWAQVQADGLTPRFETSQTWARGLRAFNPTGDDLRMDPALDWLTARRLLMQTRAEHLALSMNEGVSMLVGAAYELAPLAAARPAASRQAWGVRLRTALQSSLGGDAFAVESYIGQLAVAWVASSSYASDVLFEPRARLQTDRVIALRAAQSDPLLLALSEHWGPGFTIHDLLTDLPPAGAAIAAFHACQHAQDEVQLAAACVLRRLEQGRAPVALVAQDRALTRQIRATLAGAGVALRDETGWKLSTSRLAAQLMLALRVCRPQVDSDAVLAWLKQSPGWDAAAVQALEDRLRQLCQGRWDAVTPPDLDDALLTSLWARIQQRRQAWRGARPLAQWLDQLRLALAQDGLWESWQSDAAGVAMARALCLDTPQRLQDLASGRPWRAADFVAWVDDVLEAVSFQPEAAPAAEVVILPLVQLPGRQFDAVVIPGCDELRMPLSPEPRAWWTPAQRALLGLPSREEQSQALRRTWHAALAHPVVDVLWRCQDEAGETLLASPLVRLLRLQLGTHDLAPDPRASRALEPRPVPRPGPRAASLALEQLSASAYQDMRHCPYRFFALRLLGLREIQELDAPLEKRDFGQWLHTVLQEYHQALDAAAGPDAAARQRLLDACAESACRKHGFTAEEFLPFMAAWPNLRDSYLNWQIAHESSGARFAQGEVWREQALGSVQLVGRIDRLDQLAGDGCLVIDYKTESLDVTRQRIREPLEDTQLAFYAALLPSDAVRAAYLHLGERGAVELLEQHEISTVRDALVEGIGHDLQRVADGAPLRALGEGPACERCAARGLCRRDFWQACP